jgi:hypothetical protein
MLVKPRSLDSGTAPSEELLPDMPTSFLEDMVTWYSSDAGS